MSTRRHILIRTVASFTGDVAVSVSLASTCAWLVSSAALGVFLAFLAWLVALLLALAISQHVVHPIVEVVLSDRKLDDALGALRRLGSGVRSIGRSLWPA